MKEPKLGMGVYTIAEAARLVGLPSHRLRSWFTGPRGNEQAAFLKSDYDRVNGDLAISFQDMIDAAVASKLRAKKFSLQTLRKVYVRLAERFGGRHGFCSQDLYTDGKTIFLHEGDKSREREVLLDLKNWQGTFVDIMLPGLEKLDFNEQTHLASRWRIADGVVIDPALNFGKPVVEKYGLSTTILANAFHANANNVKRVADWYCVSQDAVNYAVAFEAGLWKRRAAA